MLVYAVVMLRIHDRSWCQEYVANVPGIVRTYGGHYLAVGTHVIVEEGDCIAPDQIAILTFPSLSNLEACLSSDEYAPYKASRMGKANTEILAFETIRSRQHDAG